MQAAGRSCSLRTRTGGRCVRSCLLTCRLACCAEPPSRRAAERLAGAQAVFVQADVLDLPFAWNRFTTVACHAMLHVLEDPWAALAALRDQLAPGGRFFASMLVSDRAPGRVFLAALHRAGEVGPPRSRDELAGAARELFGNSAEVDRSGSMAWLRAAAEPS